MLRLFWGRGEDELWGDRAPALDDGEFRSVLLNFS
jgi:hypothetical protein